MFLGLTWGPPTETNDKNGADREKPAPCWSLVVMGLEEPQPVAVDAGDERLTDGFEFTGAPVQWTLMARLLALVLILNLSR